jgi:hypothetical protein
MVISQHRSEALDKPQVHAYCNTMRANLVEVPKIPEFEPALKQYGVSWDEQPPYTIIGMVRTPLAGRRVGVLGFTSNKFHAYLLRKKFVTCGLVRIERTKYHPDAKTKEFFDVEDYFKKLLKAR